MSGCASACCLARGSGFLTILVVRAFAWGVPLGHGAWIAALLALAVALIGTTLGRPSPLRAAVALDAAAGLKERLSTALAVQESRDPFARAAVQDAEKIAARVHVPSHIRRRAPDLWPWSTAVTAAALLLFWLLPPLNLFAHEQPEGDRGAAGRRREREQGDHDRGLEAAQSDQGTGEGQSRAEEPDRGPAAAAVAGRSGHQAGGCPARSDEESGRRRREAAARAGTGADEPAERDEAHAEPARRAQLRQGQLQAHRVARRGRPGRRQEGAAADAGRAEGRRRESERPRVAEEAAGNGGAARQALRAAFEDGQHGPDPEGAAEQGRPERGRGEKARRPAFENGPQAAREGAAEGPGRQGDAAAAQAARQEDSSRTRRRRSRARISPRRCRRRRRPARSARGSRPGRAAPAPPMQPRRSPPPPSSSPRWRCPSR